MNRLGEQLGEPFGITLSVEESDLKFPPRLSSYRDQLHDPRSRPGRERQDRMLTRKPEYGFMQALSRFAFVARAIALTSWRH
jgi:hypothetical protein